jgi:hypothetical protein
MAAHGGLPVDFVALAGFASDQGVSLDESGNTLIDAERAAVRDMYSLVQTARANDLEAPLSFSSLSGKANL